MNTRDNDKSGARTGSGQEAQPPSGSTQPPPSGGPGSAANQGSPAARVMKEFAKTDAESGGREAAAGRKQ